MGTTLIDAISGVSLWVILFHEYHIEWSCCKGTIYILCLLQRLIPYLVILVSWYHIQYPIAGIPYFPHSEKDAQEDNLLLEHLKKFTKPDVQSSAALDMLDVVLPEDFHGTYKRLSQRSTYRACSDNLSITLSKEESENNSGRRVTVSICYSLRHP